MNIPRIRLIASSIPCPEVEADWLVVPVAEDASPSPALLALDNAAGGLISRLREAGDFKAKANELLPLFGANGVRAKRVMLIGLGTDTFNRRAWHRAAATALRSIAGRKCERVAVAVPEAPRGMTVQQAALALAVGAIQGCHGPEVRKALPSRFAPAEIVLIATEAIDSGTLARATAEGEAIAFARDLVNTPPNDLYPESFATIAQGVATDSGFTCEVWDEKRLLAERMGAILGIAQGSDKPARFLILRYRGGGDRTLAYVGKGVTFDSGGLSLKTNDQMLDMKCDMAGGAAVLAAFQAVARLKLPVNLLGLIPLVENMPGGRSVKLGDVLTARNGKTIEILNTDAEGRVILADALSYAAEQKIDHIVDLATLTGACMVALGSQIAGLMGNNDVWNGEVLKTATLAGEPAWQLPMHRDFDEALKSNVADCKNVGGNRYGGAIIGAKFLEQFVAGIPWVHLDIAGPAWAEKDSPWQDAGGTGAYVRSLVELAVNYRQWAATLQPATPVRPNL